MKVMNVTTETGINIVEADAKGLAYGKPNHQTTLNA